jgi:hypothetical protein
LQITLYNSELLWELIITERNKQKGQSHLLPPSPRLLTGFTKESHLPVLSLSHPPFELQRFQIDSPESVNEIRQVLDFHYQQN